MDGKRSKGVDYYSRREQRTNGRGRKSGVRGGGGTRTGSTKAVGALLVIDSPIIGTCVLHFLRKRN